MTETARERRRKRYITRLTEMGAAMSTLNMLLQRHRRPALVYALVREGLNGRTESPGDGGALDVMRTLEVMWSCIAPCYGDAYGSLMHRLAQYVDRRLPLLDQERRLGGG